MIKKKWKAPQTERKASSADKNEELVDMYQSGAIEALETLLRNNDQLIRRVINELPKKELSCSVDEDDLYQELCIIFQNCASRYDHGRNVKFTTFAYEVMFYAGLNMIAKNSYDIPIPRGMVTRTAKSLDDPLQFSPEDLERMESYRYYYKRLYRLDDIAYDDERCYGRCEDVYVRDVPENWKKDLLKEMLWSFVNETSTLSQEERYIILEIYRHGRSVASLANELGQCRQWINTIRRKGIKKLQLQNNTLRLFSQEDVNLYNCNDPQMHVAVRV